jgi:thiaminase
MGRGHEEQTVHHSFTENMKIDPDHLHSFVLNNYNFTEENCSCGLIRVSQEEADRRKEEWNNFYSLVRETEAHHDYQKMKRLVAVGDTEGMKEVLKRVHSRLVDTGKKDDWGETIFEYHSNLVKPDFPDPATSRRYLVY